MNQNEKIARKLVKLAKMLVASGENGEKPIDKKAIVKELHDSLENKSVGEFNNVLKQVADKYGITELELFNLAVQSIQ